MFIFQGELSNKNQKYLLRKNKILGLIGMGILVVISAVPIILFSYFLHWAFSLIFVLLALMLILNLIPLKDEIKYTIPAKITIYDSTITSEGKGFNKTKSISMIKKIIDFGDFYHIIFNFPYKDIRFLCQKDLLKEGSLTDFEEKFKDLIIKN